MNSPESYGQSTDYLNDLYKMMKVTNPESSFKDIIAKISDKIAYDFMYTFKSMYKTIDELDHEFFILDYRDGSKTWHEWARKGRGTALYFDHETERFIVLKQLLQRGTEILTNALKKRGVDETQDVVQGDLPFSQNILDTMEILDTNQPFPGFLSMKVDGSLTSITFLKLGSPQSNQIDKLFKVSEPTIELLVGKRISDICKTFGMNGFISTKGTILMGGNMIHWNLGCIICDVLRVSWENLTKELEDKGLINNPENSGIFYLIDMYLPKVLKKLIILSGEAMPDNDSHTLMFESVCPNRTDIFKTQTHTELAVSYKIPLFRFLGITSGFGMNAGVFKPHCDPILQQVIAKYKLNDPLFWSNDRMTALEIEQLLNIDLEKVINGEMTEGEYIIKNKPNNIRILNSYEPLDFEGFILYRLLPNGFYEYNKIKHHLYYTFHKLGTAITKGRVSNDYLMSLSEYVAEVFPSLKIYKVFKMYFNNVYLDAINEFRNIFINEYYILEPSEEKIRLIEPFNENPKMIKAYLKLQPNKRIKMIQHIIRKRLPQIITEKLLSVGIIISPNSGKTEAENRNSKKKFNESLCRILSIYGFDLASENWDQQIQIHLGELSKDIFPFIRQIVEPKKDISTSDVNISVNFISFNIMSRVMYSTKKDFSNAHGLIKRYQGDQINDEENNERLLKIKKIIGNHKADIVFFQEANQGWPGEVLDFEDYQLVSNKSLFGLKCNYQYSFRRGRTHHTQKDATQIFYNPERFNLIDSESGCFGRIKHRRSEKLLLDQFADNDKPTGSGYSFGLVEDIQSGERIFLVNIHVKILDWSAENYPIDKVGKEFVQHFGLFLREIGDIEPTDKLLIAGDFNADDRIYQGHSDYTTYDELNQRNWREFMSYVFSKFEKVFGTITEVEKGLVSSVHCKGDKGNQDDHIFINESFDTDIISHKNRLYPLLINCMESNDFEQFKQSYSLAKREYERVTRDGAEVTMGEIRRVSKRLQEFIDMKNAIKVNNIIRRNGLAVSDHYPKIVTLTYKTKTPRQITQMSEPIGVPVEEGQAGPAEGVMETFTSMPPKRRQVREVVTESPLPPQRRLVREMVTEPPRTPERRVFREMVTEPPRTRTPQRRQVREMLTSTPLPAQTVEPPMEADAHRFLTQNPVPQVGGQPKVLVLYPISTIGVGKNYLFERLGPALQNESTVVFNLESDQFPKGQFGSTAAKKIKDHFKGKVTKNKNVVLILNKNFPPNAWKVTKELKALEGELKKLSNVHKIGIEFPKNLLAGLDDNELFVTLKRVMQRRDHPKQVDGSNLNNMKIVLSAFMAISIQSWNSTNVSKELINLGTTYNHLIKFNWLTEAQRENIGIFLKINPKFQDFINFMKEYKSPSRFGIDIEHFISLFQQIFPAEDIFKLLKEIETVPIMVYSNIDSEIENILHAIRTLL